MNVCLVLSFGMIWHWLFFFGGGGRSRLGKVKAVGFYSRIIFLGDVRGGIRRPGLNRRGLYDIHQ